jgi:hypothetical protein
VPTRVNVASRYLGNQTCKYETNKISPASCKHCASSSPRRRRLGKKKKKARGPLCPAHKRVGTAVLCAFWADREENGAGAPAKSPSQSPGQRPARPTTAQKLRPLTQKTRRNFLFTHAYSKDSTQTWPGEQLSTENLSCSPHIFWEGVLVRFSRRGVDVSETTSELGFFVCESGETCAAPYKR